MTCLSAAPVIPTTRLILLSYPHTSSCFQCPFLWKFAIFPDYNFNPLNWWHLGCTRGRFVHHAQGLDFWTGGGKKAIFTCWNILMKNIILYNIPFIVSAAHTPLKNHHLSAITCTPPIKTET